MDLEHDPWDTEASNLERRRAHRERERRQASYTRGTAQDSGQGGSGGDAAWDDWTPLMGPDGQFTGTVDAEDQLRRLQHIRAPNDYPPKYNGNNPASEAEGYLKQLKQSYCSIGKA